MSPNASPRLHVPCESPAPSHQHLSGRLLQQSLYLIAAQLLFVHHTEARKMLLQSDYRTLKWLLTTRRIQIKPYSCCIDPIIRAQSNFPNASLFPIVYTPVYPSRDSDTLNFFVFFSQTQLFLILGPLQMVFLLELSSTRSACVSLMEKAFPHCSHWLSCRSQWEILGSDHHYPFNVPQRKINK